VPFRIAPVGALTVQTPPFLAPLTAGYSMWPAMQFEVRQLLMQVVTLPVVVQV
jgi:hypothetical protein